MKRYFTVSVNDAENDEGHGVGAEADDTTCTVAPGKPERLARLADATSTWVAASKNKVKQQAAVEVYAKRPWRECNEEHVAAIASTTSRKVEWFFYDGEDALQFGTHSTLTANLQDLQPVFTTPLLPGVCTVRGGKYR